MNEITAKLQNIAASLLEKGQVDLFIAWEKGRSEHQVRPVFVRSPEQVERIVYNEYCIYNLANALLRFRDGKEKIGIAVKGCDSRGIVRLLEDRQIKRDRLYIVGIGCEGQKDPLQVIRAASALGWGQDNNSWADKCLDCIQPNPVIFDEKIGADQPPRQTGPRFQKVMKIENLPREERAKFFEEALSPCIRCYACRQACIACDCRVCIFDETRPQWVGRETNESDTFMFHLVRASHMAGRCVECGECQRVCPVHIPLMLLNQKLIKEVDRLFGPYDAGMEYIEGSSPPLSVFRENDPDDFL